MPNELRSRATAFGKVILGGEHAVVYGVPAIAAALPHGIELCATPLADRHADITLEIPQWDLDLHLQPDNEHPVARAALEVLAFCDGPVRGWKITGRSQIPARAGLGSSAALTVALARLVLGQDADNDEIRAASLAGESVFHGSPSGIDTELAIFGGVRRFVRGESVEALCLPKALSLWVVPSGIARNTADQVDKVRQRFLRFPEIQAPMLSAIAAGVRQMEAALNISDFKALAELFSIQHELLSALGVSSPALDGICAKAQLAGAWGAKLTGAGHGGSVLVLGPHDGDLSDALHQAALEFCSSAPPPFAVRIEST